MLAPVPAEPVFTVDRRTVRAEVPRFLELWRFLSDLLTTFLATFVGGGGAAGGGTGSGTLGVDMHIFISLCCYGLRFRFGLHNDALGNSRQTVVHSGSLADTHYR